MFNQWRLWVFSTIMAVALSPIPHSWSLVSKAPEKSFKPGKNEGRIVQSGLYPHWVAAVQNEPSSLYSVHPADRGQLGSNHSFPIYRADNQKHQMTVDFHAEGPALRIRGTEEQSVRMALVRYGYGQNLIAVKPATVVAEGNRVEYRRGNLTEWYLNGPLGLEQGFTLTAPPVSTIKTTSDLVVMLQIEGSLTPVVADDRQSLRLTNSESKTVFRYGGLYVYDSREKRLPAWLEQNGQQLRIHVDDAHAVYPLTIDPLLSKETKIVSDDHTFFDRFGNAVAITPDGNIAVVGAFRKDKNDLSQVGAAYVFIRSGGDWTQHSKLTASDGAETDVFGISVAISEDGNIIAIGAKNDTPEGQLGNQGPGSAYIFRRKTAIQDSNFFTWTESKKVTASNATADAFFGTSIAVSGDTVVVGAIKGDGKVVDSGAAYVFVKDHGGTNNWGEQKILVASDGTARAEFGRSVDIEGDLVVVGSPLTDAVYIFHRDIVLNKPTWTQETKLVPDGSAPNSNSFGRSVAISRGTVVVGEPLGESAYVFKRILPIICRFPPCEISWPEQGKLTASSLPNFDLLGWSVDIDGDRIVVGAQNDDSAGDSFGSVHVFIRTEGVWIEHTELLPSDGQIVSSFGTAVTLAGNTVIVGAPNHRLPSGIGQAYVYELFKAQSDFNNDGTSDILWRKTDGTVAIWQINGLQLVEGVGWGRRGAQ